MQGWRTWADRMGVRDFWRFIPRLVFGLVMLLPLAALVPVSVIDVGPGGRPRFSIFPLALTALDPFVWTCVRNSMVVAGVVVAMALPTGIILGRTIDRHRFWGRPLLAGIGLAPAVIHPTLLALGLTWLLDVTHAWDWPERGEIPLESVGLAHPLSPWLAWAWAAIVPATAAVGLTTMGALRRLQPGWEDAGRLSGASSRRIWRSLLWPEVRPEVARTAGLTFLATLADPTVPMILGIRRTLGFQLAVTVVRDDPFPRLAALGWIAILLSLLVRVVVRWWGGTQPVAFLAPAKEVPGRAGLRTTPLRASLAASFLLAWSLTLILPVAGLLALGVGSDETGRTSPRSIPVLAAGILARFGEAPNPRLMTLSLMLGTGALFLVMVLCWSFPSLKPGYLQKLWRAVILFLVSIVPPPILAVCVLAIPHMFALTSKLVARDPRWEALSSSLGWCARLGDPHGIPGLLVIVATCLIYVPRWLLTWQEDFVDDEARMQKIEAAILLGAGARRASRLATARGRRLPPSILILTAVLAGTSMGPAYLLAPTEESWTVGPAIVHLAVGSKTERYQAAALACLTVAGLCASFGSRWVFRPGSPRGFPGTRDLP